MIAFQGLSESAGAALFLVGIFTGNSTLWLIGGITVTAAIFLEVGMGISNPVLPEFFALGLCLFVNPWYLGLFWVLTVLSSINTFSNIRKILNPTFFLERASENRRGMF